MFQNTHWKHKMKCIQIENEVKTINTMRHQTIDKWKGTAAAAGPPGPRGPSPAAAAPFHLYMVWCLIVLIVFTSFSISIHFILCFQCVFDLYFSDWVIQGGPAAAKKSWFFGLGLKRGPPAAKSQVFLIFRSLLNAFWHADLRELVESFRNHQSDLKKVQSTSSYGQNIPKKEFWSQCCIWLFWTDNFVNPQGSNIV